MWVCVCVCETSRLNRSYSNRSVWSAHKGRVLAHDSVEAWGTKQCTLVSVLVPPPGSGLSPSHAGCQLLHQDEKNHSAPENSGGNTDAQISLGMLKPWCVGKTRLFVPTFFPSLSFFFPPSLSVWKSAQCSSCHSLCGWRWLDLSCGGSSVWARCCRGILLRLKIPLYTPFKSSCGQQSVYLEETLQWLQDVSFFSFVFPFHMLSLLLFCKFADWVHTLLCCV